jgi:NAD+ synthase (glutamine-hydrolysing)
MAYTFQKSYIRIATACPLVSIANPAKNIESITNIYNKAIKQGVSVVTFPELAITGYTIGDLVQQKQLLLDAKEALLQLAAETKEHPTAIVVGLPFIVNDNLYDVAAFLADGEIKGIVPKSNLPSYSEFYENRWFKTWQGENIHIDLGGNQIPFGTKILFDIDGVLCGIEICEDLWIATQPSELLVKSGAKIILNPSASPEQIGKSAYRQDLVKMQSGRLICGYAYAGCDQSESTAEIVMGGHQIIAANGTVLAKKQPFERKELLLTDIDVDHLEYDRRRQKFKTLHEIEVIKTTLKRTQTDLIAKIEKTPFLPEETEEERAKRLDMVIAIQAQGLARRLITTNNKRLILGLSGGLDSTLAVLVAMEAAKVLGQTPAETITAISMPGPASSDRTQDNAAKLAASLGIPCKIIPIEPMIRAEFEALDHSGKQDIAYENIQARARTSILFNYANMSEHPAIVLGTGDLSEIALGWSTYNADQQSHYNVNASVPKTMVRALVAHYAKHLGGTAHEIVSDIVATPISPELTKDNNEAITQNTEDIIGPYELHDFFLYYQQRWGDTPGKIAALAKHAFGEKYSKETIEKWLTTFRRRFRTSQFKRDNMPNGPKIGAVSLSPRGDWRMPSDIS